MNSARSPFVLVLSMLLLTAAVAQQPLRAQDTNPPEPAGETVDKADVSVESVPQPEAQGSPEQNLLQRFEEKVDVVSGQVVGVIYGVLFHQFVGRKEFSEKLETIPFGSPEFSELIRSVEAALSDDEKSDAAWTASFVREHLSLADPAELNAQLDAIRAAAKVYLDNASAVVDLQEADFEFRLAQGDLTDNEAAVVADVLHHEFCSSKLRSMKISLADLQPEQSRVFTAKKSGIPIVVAWLIAGAVFFTLRMGFINFRGFFHAIRVTLGRYDNPEHEGEVSHFQALTAALSATVGLGNIAGVAIAVGIGGPGATFWMIVAGLLGMSSKFTECTLGQMYRRVRSDGRIMGGAMYYLSNGLKDIGLGPLGAVLGIMFAVLCVLASLGGGNAFQVNQSINAVQQAFPDTPWLADTAGRIGIGLVMAALVAVVIIGGIRRIASIAEKIVPLMCGVYVLACVYILVMNASAIPDACRLIVASAFNPQAGYGALLGVLILGFQRAAFSNEAGIGSAAIAHSAAKTEYPVREGIVALLEPFIDTVVVCTMTALVIVITGAFDVNNEEFSELITTRNGAGLTVQAMKSQVSWFPVILAVAVMLFAYSTMISWSYYGERCWSFLFGDRSSIVYRVIFVFVVVIGSIMSATNVLDLSDLLILAMAFPNILGAVLLSGKVKRDLDAYWRKLMAGEMKEYG